MTKHEFSAATQYQLLLSGDWSGENVFTIPTSKDHISLFEIYTPSQLLWSQCGGAIMAAGPGSLAQVDALALWQLWQQAPVNTLSPACQFQANFQLLFLEDW